MTSTKSDLFVQTVALPLEPPPADDPDVDAAAWSAMDVSELSQLEYSVHACPPALQRELRRVFASDSAIGEHLADADRADGVLAIATFQPARNDLVAIGADVELEKDVKLLKFYRWCERLCAVLKRQGFVADFIDPCSGYPVQSARGASPYSEIDGLRTLLPYATFSTGPCVVVSHPRWNTRCYPATLFAAAPADAVHAAVDEITRDHAAD